MSPDQIPRIYRKFLHYFPCFSSAPYSIILRDVGDITEILRNLKIISLPLRPVSTCHQSIPVKEFIVIPIICGKIFPSIPAMLWTDNAVKLLGCSDMIEKYGLKFDDIFPEITIDTSWLI